MKRLHLALAVAAGFAGGVLSHSFTALTVHAQSPAAPAAEVRARSFLLVDDHGVIVGKLSAESGGRPAIRLYDAGGREVWSAESPLLRAATGR